MSSPTVEALGWELRGVWKSFPGVVALRNVSMTLQPGQVHALVGQNGGGKSTVVKILSGVFGPDRGEIWHGGRPAHLASPSAARRDGVATIFQEFSLVGSLSVAENIDLGTRFEAKAKKVAWSALRKRARQALHELDVDVDVDRPVKELSVAEQQLVEIAKALSADPTLLILDEPTTALSLDEAARLRDLVKRLAASGRCVLYISHRLEELPGFADVVTVLRDGVAVATVGGADLRLDDVIAAMLGTDTRQRFTKASRATATRVLEVKSLCANNGTRNVSLTLHEGEVLGLAGVTGSGRTEIVRALVGADKVTDGEIMLRDRPIRPKSPRHAVKLGIGLLPENRKTDGLFFNFTGPPNITAARLKSLLRGFLLSLTREREAGERLAKRMRMTPHAMRRHPSSLSGGNQQKLVLGRWLFADCGILCLDEPTQGIDVGAKAEIYTLIDELTTEGVAVILISSEHSELLAVADRISIVRDHTITTTRPAGELDEFILASLTAGATA